ncbi:flagellar transcriptional regulator FlhD [Polaromonas aquatica]|uniref:Flagellar transcriptional regulator FlhD n=1 Tax=Polaromonas aquatica TaxID=332657 RepID=A0ABW1TWK2_9BURK
MSESSKAAADIAELNLGYLLLVQRLIKEDLATAMFRLGLNRELATLLGRMTLAQIVQIASTGHVIFSFRLDAKVLEHAITPTNLTTKLHQAHVAIMLAKESAETAELAEAA